MPIKIIDNNLYIFLPDIHPQTKKPCDLLIDQAYLLCRREQESRQVKNPYHRDSALQYLCMTTHALHQVKALP